MGDNMGKKMDIWKVEQGLFDDVYCDLMFVAGVLGTIADAKAVVPGEGDLVEAEYFLFSKLRDQVLAIRDRLDSREIAFKPKLPAGALLRRE
jgi:hypothetical protein